MWILRVVVMVVVVIGCASVEDVVPDYAKCAHILYGKVENKLTKDMTFLKNTLKKVNMNIDEVCSSTDPQSPAAPSDNLLGKMEELMEKVVAMDNKINEALTKMNAMENTLQKIDQLATAGELSHLNGSVSHMLDETIRYMESRVGTMATKAEVEELLVAHVGKVEQAVTESSETCGSDAKLMEVLQEVREVKENVAKVTNETEATKEEVKRYSEQNTMQELRNVMTKMEELQGGMQTLTGLGDELRNIKQVVVEVFNNTLPPSPTTPAPTLPPGELFPCEDSTFRGVNSMNVCQSAVRFKKCYLETVSYHCCHTCTSQGQLPEVGPWRYVNDTRQVSTIDVIRFFTL